MKRIGFISIIISIILLGGMLEISGCKDSRQVENRLDTAESLMEERPDSSLSILKEIKDSELNGKRLKARYALLKSMALDKNYIDTTTFDVLQPAIDYYLKHGNADEKLKTYYYQGVIYKNSGDDDLAMQSCLKALDIEENVSDSLTLARLLVAQSTLFYSQYRISDFLNNNLKAGNIFGSKSKIHLQLISYSKALSGATILNDRSKADSIINICNAIINDSIPLKKLALRSYLTYSVSFGNKEEIKSLIEEVEQSDISEASKLNIARAHSKIGEPEKGLEHLYEAEIAPDDILDSLSYWSIKTEILENMSKEKAALESFRNYSRLLEVYHTQLFSNELLFSEKKHQMEIESMGKIHRRDNAIKWILVGVAVLICIICFIYYRYRLNKAGRIIAERDAEMLQLEADKLHLESEKLQLESENLHLAISQLESEQERLTALLEQRDEISSEMRDVIRERLDMLNGLLAKEITNEDSYAKPFKKYVETLRKDRMKFQDSTRKAFQAVYPKFMVDLINKGLTEREINYVCLYALGLRGKEIGTYLDLARHYNISSDIRRKLGLDSNGSNLGPYIRKMMKEN